MKKKWAILLACIFVMLCLPGSVYAMGTVTITGVYNSSNGGDLRWNTVSGAEQYVIYRTNAGKKTLLTRVSGSTASYMDTSIKNNCWGKVYVYSIAPVAGGKTYKAGAGATLQRLAPMLLSSVKSNNPGKADVQFNVLTGSNKANGYEIQYAKSLPDLYNRSGSFKSVTLNGRNNLKKTVSNLTEGAVNYFRVRAYVNYTHSVTGVVTKTWSQYSSSRTVTIKKAASSGTGSGTQADPYRISTFAQLKKIPEHNGCYFIQVADINCGGAEHESLFYTDNPFTGKYNGNGKSISNLKLTTRYQANKSYDVTGIWGEIGSTGSITNLTVKNITMVSTYKKAAGFGPICALNYGTISDVSASNVTIYNQDPLKENGGICGKNYGTITNCTSSNFIDQKSGSKNSGGIAGYNNGTIRNCTVRAADLRAQSAGGIAGYNHYQGTITGCKVYGPINYYASWLTGDFVGENYGGTVTNCQRYS